MPFEGHRFVGEIAVVGQGCGGISDQYGAEESMKPWKKQWEVREPGNGNLLFSKVTQTDGAPK
jgi:hypothetical protein